MSRIRVALVGDFSKSRDEGYKNVSHALADALGRRGDILVSRVDIKRLRRPGTIASYLRARPHVVHIIAQPSPLSLVIARMARAFPPHTRVVLSALRSEQIQARLARSSLWRGFARALTPHLLLAQDPFAESCFRRLGFNVAIVPNGVDISRFRPGTTAEKEEIRRGLGLDPKRPVAVHVGHLEAARRLDSLIPLVDAGMQVFVAGSTYMGTDDRLVARLRGAGITVVAGYVPDIERVYRMADCYVFPVEVSRSLTTPLSVLEALASGIGVVATRFRGLEHLFDGSGAITFVDDVDSLSEAVAAAMLTPSTECRALVRGLSWDNVAERLRSQYSELLRA